MVCLIIKFKTLGVSDVFWFQTFGFFCIIIVFEVTHIWRPKTMTNTWPSHFHHLQKWTIDLVFKIMKSANRWQFLRTPLPTPLLCRHHKCMFLFCFFWSLVFHMSECKLNFEFYENSVKLSSVKLSKKPSKLIFSTMLVPFWTTFC